MQVQPKGETEAKLLPQERLRTVKGLEQLCSGERLRELGLPGLGRFLGSCWCP